MKVKKELLYGALIGGTVATLMRTREVSSLKEDSKEREAKYISKVQELDKQIRQAQNKDEIIELQRQQSLVDKAEIDSLRQSNQSLYDYIQQLESRQINPQTFTMNGATIYDYFYMVHAWKAYSEYLRALIPNNVLVYARETFHDRITSMEGSNLQRIADNVGVNSRIFNTYNQYLSY